MDDVSESASLNEGVEKESNEKESNICVNSKVTEIYPLAFTIEFGDQKYDESKKSKVRERLSAFALKHKRNPSLPDFRDVKNSKISPPMEKIISVKSVSFQHVPVTDKKLEKSAAKSLEMQWKSTPLKAAKSFELKSPFLVRGNLGMKDSFIKSLKVERRYSLDGNNDTKMSCQNIILSTSQKKCDKVGSSNIDDEIENKSDTVSEAGTYTVDREENVGTLENNANRGSVLEENEVYSGDVNGVKKSYQSSWIKDWVRDVEKQNMLNLGPKESSQMNCGSEIENSSYCISKIPSPLNTLNKKAKPRYLKPGGATKSNSSTFHKRSSSLGAKENNEYHGSESSLETESFLRATESVMTSIQNRMKLSHERNPNFRKVEKRSLNYKERPHPPSTASDTDTNSETDAKAFKKPIGNPFTSARLNRAFSLRRAKADPEKDFCKPKSITTNCEGNGGAKQVLQTSKIATSKPPSSAPFSRLDCGRFSMRSTVSGVRSNVTNQSQKKDVKKSNNGNRSTSSLSSREVEFQNWRRRKSFDPMKAAAEGRKKELAKRAAGNSSFTQSVNLSSAIRTRSNKGNPVLRSASFHSTAEVFAAEEDPEEPHDHSTDDQDESASSSWLSGRRERSNNSPLQHCVQCKPKSGTPVCSSRSSLISETHSSPSRRLKSNDLENLVLSAICDSSYKLKSKSCRLLKKLNCLYETGEEKSFRLREEVAILESGQNSAKNSPVHQPSSKDLFAILKNLKGVENAFNVLEDVLFDENLEVYSRE